MDGNGNKICSICNGPIDPQRTPEGEIFWEDGHNAMPINNGRCCTRCDELVVIPARIAILMQSKEK